jgi:hypothetical protein
LEEKVAGGASGEPSARGRGHGLTSKGRTHMKVPMNWRRAMGAAAMALSVLGGGAVLGLAGPAMAQTGATKDAPDYSKMQKRDLIVFTSGNQVEGVVLSETDTQVHFLLMIGGIRSETTYDKSTILEIKRNEFKPKETKDGDKSEVKDESAPVISSSSGNSYEHPVDDKGKPIPAGATKVYIMNLTGEFGHDVSNTPMKEAMDDVVKAQPDVLIVQFNNDYSLYGKETQDYGIDIYQYDVLEKARELDTLLMNRINTGGEFKKKPHVVAWINKALGGAAFLPFTIPDIYFTSQGRLGSMGVMEALFASMGDQVFRQKQRSLRVGRAKGLCAEGGHDERIMSAMSWGEYILSYRIVGGKVEFYEGMPPGPDWFLLKDDGAINEAHRDTLQDRVRLKGNDFLTLDAPTAFNIGFSKGTADSVDDLLAKMGITRNYAIMKTKSPEIWKDWSRNIDKAESDVARLIREFRAVEVKPPAQYEQRTEARGRRLRLLEQIKSIVKVYREAINPQKVGSPDGLIDQLDVIIDRIKTEQTLDRRP